MIKKFGLSAMALVAGFSLIACGDDSSSASAEEESSSSVVEETSSPSKPAAKSSSSVASEEECDEELENCDEEESSSSKDDSSSSMDDSSSSEVAEEGDGSSSSVTSGSSEEEGEEAHLCGNAEYDPSTHFCQKRDDGSFRVVAYCGDKKEYLYHQECRSGEVIESCVIDDGKDGLSITYAVAYGWKCNDGQNIEYTDPRDYGESKASKVYHVTAFDGKLFWMVENMRYPVTVDEDVPVSYACHKNENCSEADMNKYGRFYRYTAAELACPAEDGWRLPTMEEWKSVTGKSKNTTALMDQSGWTSSTVTPQYPKGINGFALMGAGARMGNTSQWISQGLFAAMWAEKTNDTYLSYIYFNINSEANRILESSVIYDNEAYYYASVRCVKSAN